MQMYKFFVSYMEFRFGHYSHKCNNQIHIKILFPKYIAHIWAKWSKKVLEILVLIFRVSEVYLYHSRNFSKIYCLIIEKIHKMTLDMMWNGSNQIKDTTLKNQLFKIYKIPFWLFEIYLFNLKAEISTLFFFFQFQ